MSFIRKEIFSKSFFPKTIREWNNLSADIKGSDSVKSFKNKLKVIYGPKEAKNYLHMDMAGPRQIIVECVLVLCILEAIFLTTTLLTHRFAKMKFVIM